MTMNSAARVAEQSSTSGASSPSWHAPAAWGAGLMQIALGAGAVIADSSGAVSRATGSLLIAMGLAALVWGGVSLARARLVLPRIVVGVALAGIVILAAALALDPVRISVFAVAAASVLLIAVALAAVAALRRAGTGRADAASPRIVELLIAAVLVAALVTPALSATEAGRLAPDHGSHGVMVDPSHH
ncbi:hypothetical protein [Microbacterium pygmaeum]|nr:hypothetical protein [Microbacterium pygmaeum]